MLHHFIAWYGTESRFCNICKTSLIHPCLMLSVMHVLWLIYLTVIYYVLHLPYDNHQPSTQATDMKTVNTNPINNIWLLYGITMSPKSRHLHLLAQFHRCFFCWMSTKRITRTQSTIAPPRISHIPPARSLSQITAPAIPRLWVTSSWRHDSSPIALLFTRMYYTTHIKHIFPQKPLNGIRL